jgi:WD40 repeat protein
MQSAPAAGDVLTVAADASGQRIVWTTGRDNQSTEVHWWEPGSNSGEHSAILPAVGIRAVAIGRDGQWIAAISTQSDNLDQMPVWLMSTEGSAPPAIIHKVPMSLGCVAFSPDDRQLAFGSEDNIEVVTVPSGERVCTVPAAGLSTDIAWSPDGRRLAAVGYSGVVAICDPQRGKVLLQLRGLAPDRPNDQASDARVAFSADGRVLVSTNWNGSLSVWNLPR